MKSCKSMKQQLAFIVNFYIKFTIKPVISKNEKFTLNL